MTITEGIFGGDDLGGDELDESITRHPSAGEDGPRVFECPECDFSSVSQPGLARHVTRQHRNKPSEGDDSPRAPRAAPAAAEAPMAADQEVPPRPAPPAPPGVRGKRLLDRVRGRVRGGKAAPGPAPKRAPAKRVTTKRIPLDDQFSRLWARAGSRLESTNYYPSGRLMNYQAPAAGLIFDQNIRGSALDRLLLQPAARASERYQDLFYLIGPPMQAAMIQQARMRHVAMLADGKPEEAARLEFWIKAQAEAMEWTIRSMVVKLAPTIAEAEKRRAEEDAIIREAFGDLPEGVDPAQAIMSMLFDPPGTITVEEPNVSEPV